MNTNLADSLNSTIDQHVTGQRSGAVETHDLDSLCARLLAPRDVVEKLLGTGVLRSEGPVHGTDDTGIHAFNSDLLNEVRRAVLSAIVEKVVEESDGEPDQIKLAAGHALREHAKGFDKPKGAKKEFARFPSGLVQLSRLDGRFVAQEDEPGFIERTASTVGKVAAVGAAGYGAASYLRGRKLAPGGSLFDKLRAGNRANVATGRAVVGGLSAGAQRVADVLAGKIRR